MAVAPSVIFIKLEDAVSRYLLLFALATGCGGGELSPVEKCDEFVDVVCDRALDCLSSPGSHSECVQQVQQLVPCGSAKEVSASYDRCMDQVESNSCAVLFPTDPDTGEPALSLPADCNAIILVREASPSGGPDGVLSNVMRAHELAE